MRILHREAAALAALFALSGCAGDPAVLRTLTGPSRGDPWVWPQSLDGRPTVLAFWNTDVMQCLRDVPALKTLDSREGSVELVTVATGRDRAEIEKWIRDGGLGYLVLLDLEEDLARRLGVEDYPTYVFLDVNGKEVARSTDVRLARNWFDRERWQKAAEGKSLSAGRSVD
jgi:hypothetical protein